MFHKGEQVHHAPKQQRLSHAYIADYETALRLAMRALCAKSNDIDCPCLKCAHCYKVSNGIHPDLIILSRAEDKAAITVDIARDLKRSVLNYPNEADVKAYVIKNAELLNTAAQNALLQVLEEPPSNTLLILSTDNPLALLPTIRSRCVIINKAIDTAEVEEISEDVFELAEEFIETQGVDTHSLVNIMFRLGRLDKECFKSFLSVCARLISEKLHSAEYSSKCIISLSRLESLLVKASEYIEYNVAVGHISGMLCASMIDSPQETPPRLP